ncbi:MAG TPA: tetratricopeptide repeat protein, partial [Chroococcales cyanobacterium]
MRITSLALTLLTAGIFTAQSAQAIIGMPSNSWEQQYSSIEDKDIPRTEESALLSALQAAGADTYKKLIVLDALINFYEERKKFSQEEKFVLQVIDVLKKDEEYPPILIAIQYMKLTTVATNQNDLERARAYAQKASEIFITECGSGSPEHAMALNNLGWVEFEMNHQKTAEHYFLRALDMIARTLGRQNVLYGVAAANLSDLYDKQHRPGLAQTWLKRS